MSKKKRNLIVTISLVQLVLILGIANLSTLLETFVPADYWSYLPDFVVATTGVREDYLPSVGNPAVEVAAVDLLGDLDLGSAGEVEEAISEEVEPVLAQASLEPEPEGVAEIAITATPAPTDVPAETSTPAPPTPTQTPFPTPTPLPLNHQIVGLVNEPQKFNNCGPTNLAVVLNFYGDQTTQTEAANYLKPNREDRNVSPWQISDYVNEFTNLRSITRSNGNQELLQELVASGFPVVIEKGYDPEAADAFGWYGHYLTVFGYDLAKQEYNTIDTFLGPFTDKDIQAEGYTLEDGYIYSFDYVSKYWQQFNYTFYVVYEIQREEELYAILGDDYVYTEDNWEAAALRAQKEAEADPENAFTWFNLGTSLTELGKKTKVKEHYEKAAVAYDKALSLGLPSRMLWYQHGPFFAYNETGRHQDALDLADATLVDAGGRTIEEVWLHKGHTLSYLQDFEGALTAYNQALRLNEFFYPAELGRNYTQSLLDG
ncbi:MAG: C39 family peptidase [Anaerolineae bacterium]